MDVYKKPFKFVPEQAVIDRDTLLRQLGSMLDKDNDKGLANNFKIYMDNRDYYIKNYKGKYIQISSKCCRTPRWVILDGN